MKNSEDMKNDVTNVSVINRAIVIAAWSVIALTSAVTAQPATTKPETMSPPAANGPAQPDERYRIGPGDVLDIRIFNRPNLSRDAVRVEGSGIIRMPLIEGEIQAACKTEGELAKEIASRYLKYYRNPQVDVFIKEYHAREVALIGAVSEQGRYQLSRRMRLLELLTYAKGPSDKAGETINIVRGSRPNLCETALGPGDD